MNAIVKPISPSELREKALENAASSVDPRIIMVVNQMLMDNYPSHSAVIRMSEIKTRLTKMAEEDHATFMSLRPQTLNSMSVEDIIDKTPLVKIKKAFENEGWRCKTDFPGYNESYEAFLDIRAKS